MSILMEKSVSCCCWDEKTPGNELAFVATAADGRYRNSLTMVAPVEVIFLWFCRRCPLCRSEQILVRHLSNVWNLLSEIRLRCKDPDLSLCNGTNCGFWKRLCFMASAQRCQQLTSSLTYFCEPTARSFSCNRFSKWKRGIQALYRISEMYKFGLQSQNHIENRPSGLILRTEQAGFSCALL